MKLKNRRQPNRSLDERGVNHIPSPSGNYREHHPSGKRRRNSDVLRASKPAKGTNSTKSSLSNGEIMRNHTTDDSLTVRRSKKRTTTNGSDVVTTSSTTHNTSSTSSGTSEAHSRCPTIGLSTASSGCSSTGTLTNREPVDPYEFAVKADDDEEGRESVESTSKVVTIHPPTHCHTSSNTSSSSTDGIVPPMKRIKLDRVDDRNQPDSSRSSPALQHNTGFQPSHSPGVNSTPPRSSSSHCTRPLSVLTDFSSSSATNGGTANGIVDHCPSAACSSAIPSPSASSVCSSSAVSSSSRSSSSSRNRAHPGGSSSQHILSNGHSPTGPIRSSSTDIVGPVRSKVDGSLSGRSPPTSSVSGRVETPVTTPAMDSVTPAPTLPLPPPSTVAHILTPSPCRTPRRLSTRSSSSTPPPTQPAITTLAAPPQTPTLRCVAVNTIPNPSVSNNTSTCKATITEPDLLGPCEPGTTICLNGIVWLETTTGVLVVNVTWRGRTYIGTLLDATQHDFAPPCPRDYVPPFKSSVRSSNRTKRRAGGILQHSYKHPTYSPHHHHNHHHQHGHQQPSDTDSTNAKSNGGCGNTRQRQLRGRNTNSPQTSGSTNLASGTTVTRSNSAMRLQQQHDPHHQHQSSDDQTDRPKSELGSNSPETPNSEVKAFFPPNSVNENIGPSGPSVSSISDQLSEVDHQRDENGSFCSSSVRGMIDGEQRKSNRSTPTTFMHTDDMTTQSPTDPEASVLVADAAAVKADEEVDNSFPINCTIDGCKKRFSNGIALRFHLNHTKHKTRDARKDSQEADSTVVSSDRRHDMRHHSSHRHLGHVHDSPPNLTKSHSPTASPILTTSTTSPTTQGPSFSPTLGPSNPQTCPTITSSLSTSESPPSMDSSIYTGTCLISSGQIDPRSGSTMDPIRSNQKRPPPPPPPPPAPPIVCTGGELLPGIVTPSSSVRTVTAHTVSIPHGSWSKTDIPYGGMASRPLGGSHTPHSHSNRPRATGQSDGVDKKPRHARQSAMKPEARRINNSNSSFGSRGPMNSILPTGVISDPGVVTASPSMVGTHGGREPVGNGTPFPYPHPQIPLPPGVWNFASVPTNNVPGQEHNPLPSRTFGSGHVDSRLQIEASHLNGVHQSLPDRYTSPNHLNSHPAIVSTAMNLTTNYPITTTNSEGHSNLMSSSADGKSMSGGGNPSNPMDALSLYGLPDFIVAAAMNALQSTGSNNPFEAGFRSYGNSRNPTSDSNEMQALAALGPALAKSFSGQPSLPSIPSSSSSVSHMGHSIGFDSQKQLGVPMSNATNTQQAQLGNTGLPSSLLPPSFLHGFGFTSPPAPPAMPMGGPMMHNSSGAPATDRLDPFKLSTAYLMHQAAAAAGAQFPPGFGQPST